MIFFGAPTNQNTDAERARAYQTYEGGYGQTPQGESLGGPTYCALAALYLVPENHACAPQARLQRAEWHATVRWLLHMQAQACGGFAGRTNKLADACYGFWCGAALAVRHLSLLLLLCCVILIICSHGAPNVAPRFFADQILGAGDLLDAPALGAYLAQCQFKFGGISKAPGEHPGEHPLPSSPRVLNPNTACSLATMMQILITRICRSQRRQSSRRTLRGACSPSTHFLMRHTKRQGGQRSTWPPHPAIRKGNDDALFGRGEKPAMSGERGGHVVAKANALILYDNICQQSMTVTAATSVETFKTPDTCQCKTHRSLLAAADTTRLLILGERKSKAL